MANVFSGSEVVEVGIQIEKNGKDFYNTLTDKSKNKKAKDVFKYLAGEEEKHITVFRDILKSVQKYVPQESYQGEYVAYMRALAGEYVFTKKDTGAKIANNIKTDMEAVNLGIGFEKDSIIFYEGMKRAVTEDEMRVVDELIAQEHDHLRQLVDLKKKL